MNSSLYREIACAILIDPHGRFLLQQRDDVVGILHPGKIGLFGGHREGDETYLQCVVREIHEEISLFVPPNRFEHLASLDGADIDVEGSKEIIHHLGTRNVAASHVRAAAIHLALRSPLTSRRFLCRREYASPDRCGCRSKH